MRFASALLIAALGFVPVGCARKPKPPSPPPVTRAVPKPEPPPPPEPLSIPQTNVHLPAPQPLTPEAIATTQLPGEPPKQPAQPPRTTPRPPTPRPKPVNTEPAIPAGPPSTPPAAEPDRPVLTEVLSPAETKRLQDETASRAGEARRLIAQIPAARRARQKGSIDRAEFFLNQAQEAERRGDLRQASELAGRALVLARELRP